MLLLWEKRGLLRYSHPSQGCTALGPSSHLRQAPCPTQQAAACTQNLSHLSALEVVVDVHITGRGPAFLGGLEALLPA